MEKYHKQDVAPIEKENKLQSISPAVAGKNFGSKCGAKLRVLSKV